MPCDSAWRARKSPPPGKKTVHLRRGVGARARLKRRAAQTSGDVNCKHHRRRKAGLHSPLNLSTAGGKSVCRREGGTEGRMEVGFTFTPELTTVISRGRWLLLSHANTAVTSPIITGNTQMQIAACGFHRNVIDLIFFKKFLVVGSLCLPAKQLFFSFIIII